MKVLQYILLFYFGAIWGSFFYTLAFRYSSGFVLKEPVRALFGKSRCPGCETGIPWYGLIPLFGYFILRGRCRNCGDAISPVYPAAEAGFGVLILLFYFEYGASLYSLNLYLIAAVAAAIALVDVKTLTVPNSLVAVILLLSIYPVVKHGSWTDPLYGLLLMGGFFIVILLVFPGSFGGGDVKLAAAIGPVLGLKMSIVALESAILIGALTGTAWALIRRKSLRTKIPFAPFLAAGLVIALLYGRDILLLYYKTVLR